MSVFTCARSLYKCRNMLDELSSLFNQAAILAQKLNNTLSISIFFLHVVKYICIFAPIPISQPQNFNLSNLKTAPSFSNYVKVCENINYEKFA